jgi:hypothetical protein
MTTFSNYRVGQNHRPLCSHRRRHRGHLHRKRAKRLCNFVVQSRDTFIIMRQMIKLDQETMQKPLHEVEQLEVVMVRIPMKYLYGLQSQHHAGSIV